MVVKMEDKLKNTKIQEIFHTMDYGENYEKVNKGVDWIKNKKTFFAYIQKPNETVNGEPMQIKSRIDGEELCTVHVPESETIKKILLKCNGKAKWIDYNAFERRKILNKLAEEIETGADELSQIEIVARGILSKDTKTKVVPLLAQYFYYYSNFAVKYNSENPNWKPVGVAVGVISNENILSNLGLILAPALAAGYNIILHVGTAILPAVAFLVELAQFAGIPEQVIRIIPSDNGDLQPYLSSKNVAVLTSLVDLNDEKYVGFNNSNKKILNLSSNKTPVIIFDNADLDSASTSIIESAWGYQGLLPWSVNTILIQENIFETFLNKLKTKLKATKVGLGNNRMADISSTSESAFNKLNILVKLAKSQGVEVFQVDENSNSFTPTLFIGGKVGTNRVIGADGDRDANAVTVLAFRSIDEAVNLANNSRQGLAASVWTENIGVVNEVARKLRVSNVWINSHGLTSAEISLSPIKDSGVGYFGGKEGFYEYVEVKKIWDCVSGSELTQKVANPYGSFINFAKKAQDQWYRTSKLNKTKILQKFSNYIESNKQTLSSNSLPEAFLDEWISEIAQCVTEPSKNCSSTQSDFNVVSTREPLGVVAIENDPDFELRSIKLILAALFEGNAVLLLNNSPNSLPFYNDLSSRLPTAVFTVLTHSLNNVLILSAHKDLGAYFGEKVNPIYSLLPVKDSKIYTGVSDDWDEIYRKVTFSKNVWSNIGKSSSCNLSTY